MHRRVAVANATRERDDVAHDDLGDAARVSERCIEHRDAQLPGNVEIGLVRSCSQTIVQADAAGGS